MHNLFNTLKNEHCSVLRILSSVLSSSVNSISSGFFSCFSAVLSRLRGGSSACSRSSNPTVKIDSKRTKRHENDKTVKGATCGFIIGERGEKRGAVIVKDGGGGCWFLWGLQGWLPAARSRCRGNRFAAWGWLLLFVATSGVTACS